ncbi:MAG: four helix bundle protein [Imperialibacter sp.]|uniref:four helix bundle protein n=1 Tax=Imperialibacter sp. TaxID=2038411 RepID=UPI0032ECE501
MRDPNQFSFKNLIVWQKAMEFVSLSFDITENIAGHFRIKEQLESASASIAQNIAEGEGRISMKENIQYLYFARGSLYEAITLLIVLHRKGFITEEQLAKQENIGLEIVKMINQLVKRKKDQLGGK